MAHFYNQLHSFGRKTLLVFDNADDKYGRFDEKLLTKYFPMSITKHHFNHGYEDPHIIVTTRRELLLKHLEPRRIKLDPLAEKEALNLCKKSLEKYKNATLEEQKKNLPEIKRLCSCLGNYPLAIQQAIAYLNEKMGAVSINDFIEKYKTNVSVFQEKEAQVDYSYTVATVFDLGLHLISCADSSLEMMYVLSFCKAEGTGIWLFEHLYKKTVAEEAAAALVKFNLAYLDQRNISTHRVIQKVVRDRVLEKIDLIEVVLMAAFFQENNKFPILETLKENNQHIDDLDCELNKIFINHWELIQTDSLAASAVMLIAFSGLGAFPWNGIFGKEKWENSRSLLERTCFGAVLVTCAGFPKEVDEYVKYLTKKDEKKCSTLLSSIAAASKSLEDSDLTTQLEQVRQELLVNLL